MAGENGGRDGSGAPRREQDSRDQGIEKLQRENAKLIDDLDRTTRDLDRTTRDLDRTTRDLDRTTRDLDRTTRDRDRWKRRSEDLKKQLDEARRAGKRQAAPFAKDRPQGTGKRPGRRPGAQYGRQGSRRCPPKVDETHRASAPTACPDCGGAVEVTRVASQYQEELPRVRPIVRRFDIEVGRCSQCRQRVQGRHRLQISDALGAAAVQFGPGLASLVVDWLNRRNARSNAARTSSGSSTRTQASRSFLSATVWKNFIAAACLLSSRGSSSTFGVSAPWTSVVEKTARASCSSVDTPQ